MTFLKNFIFFACIISFIHAEALSVEEFPSFLERFFQDSTFQVSRVQFPFRETVSFIDGATGTLKSSASIVSKDRNDWNYVSKDAGEKGSTYKIFTDTLLKSDSELNSKFRALDYQKVDTDFNLILIFERTKGRWYLARRKYFEP